MSSRANDKNHRIWRTFVIRRDKRCIVCNSGKNREAHHLDDYSYHPDKRYDVDNGVCLCKRCHIIYHCDFNKSFRVKTTKDNFENFLKVAKYFMEIKK